MMKIVKLRAVFIIILLVFSISSSIGLTISSKDNPSIAFDIPYQDGWPREAINRIDSQPVIADLDMDGMMEIIVGSGVLEGDYFVYVFHHDGSIMDGWPIKVNGSLYGSPAIGDIDNDGDLEIAIADRNDAVYAWHHDGTNVDGWPILIGSCSSSPTLYDLDGDGDLEIILGTTEYPDRDTATVHIWHHDGTTYDGWPQMLTEYEFSVIDYSSAAVGDIDNDGDAEIINGIRTYTSGVDINGYVYVWHSDGTIMDGWPLPTEKYGDIHSGPALADIDDDEDLEIILGTYSGKILVLHHDGTYVDGWPKDLSSLLREQSVADIDQDGTIEIVSGTVAQGAVGAWKPNGTILDGWPQYTDGKIYDSPALVDIWDDGRLEILICSFDNKVHAWYHNGTVVPGFPLSTGEGHGSVPCVGDIDKDGDVELIVGSTDKNLYVWDLPTPYNEEGMEWPMFQHDLYHTGCYGFGKGFTVDANGPYYGRINHPVEFTGSVLNGEPPYT